jgi:hypothetical protein
MSLKSLQDASASLALAKADLDIAIHDSEVAAAGTDSGNPELTALLIALGEAENAFTAWARSVTHVPQSQWVDAEWRPLQARRTQVLEALTRIGQALVASRAANTK